MNKSLCGRQPCPRVCERVCHCAAGKARVKWLYLLRRGYQERSQTRPCQSNTGSPARASQNRTRSQTRYHIERVKEFALSEVWGPRQYPERKRPARIGRTLLRPFTDPLILTIFAVIFALVILTGWLMNGSRLVPYYRTEDIYTPPYYIENWLNAIEEK